MGLELDLDCVIYGDCLQYMRTLPDDCVDLVVTSPPYAEQRTDTYGGISEDEYVDWFENIGKEISRILKLSGSFVLNIKEHVRNGCRSTYVFETVLRLSRVLQWRDTFIWNKSNPFPTGSKKRLKDGFEYCFWFTKTNQYKFFPNEVLVKSDSKWIASELQRKNKGEHPVKNGSGLNMSRRYVSDMVRPSNVLTLAVDTTNHLHPATFPIGLPEFFIKLMSESGDLVFDPFAGSGTTLLAAKQLGRRYLGCDVKVEYVDIARKRAGENENGTISQK